MSDLIGNMSKVVEFLQNTPVAVGAGNRDGYAVALTTRGHLTRDSGNRQQASADIAGFQSFKLKVRRRASLTSILGMSVKVRIDNRVYTVRSWDDLGDMYITFYIDLKNG